MARRRVEIVHRGAVSATVEVKGFKEFQQKLDSLSKNVARKLLRKAMRAAANIWREEIVRRAPRLSGLLAKSITMQQEIKGDFEGELRVGYFRRAFYALVLEVGRRASTKGQRLKGVLTDISRKSGGASFMRARPFIRPSFESKKQAVLDKFVEEGKKIVAEEAGSKT